MTHIHNSTHAITLKPQDIVIHMLNRLFKVQGKMRLILSSCLKAQLTKVRDGIRILMLTPSLDDSLIRITLTTRRFRRQHRKTERITSRPDGHIKIRRLLNHTQLYPRRVAIRHVRGKRRPFSRVQLDQQLFHSSNLDKYLRY